MTDVSPTPDESDGSDEFDGLRASDTDRADVAQVLHDAVGEGRLTLTEVDERLTQVYAAKTIGQLRPIVRDLPGGDAFAPALRDSGTLAPRGRGRLVVPGPATGSAVAVMSSATRGGMWAVPERLHATAVMGEVNLDLTGATLSAREVTIQVFALMGEVDITVPDDVIVDVGAVAFMGEIDNRTYPTAPIGAPVVHITGFVMMAEVQIRSAPRVMIARGTSHQR